MIDSKICAKCAISKSSYCIQCQRETKKINKSFISDLTTNRILKNPNPNRKKYEDVKEDYGKYYLIKDIRTSYLKYQVPCCNRILESIYRNFTKKKDRANCYKCLMNGTDFKQKLSDKHSDRSNKFNVPHTIYQEYQGYTYLRDLLDKEFDIKKPALYCKADFILKPKSEKMIYG